MSAAVHHYIEARYFIVCDFCTLKQEVTGDSELNGIRLKKQGWVATSDDLVACPTCALKAERP